MNAKRRHPLVSAEELEALSGPITDGIDSWYKYRNLYLFCAAFLYIVKLLVVTEVDPRPDERLRLSIYLYLHALLVFLACFVYGWSYLKNWKFDQIAQTFAIIGVTLFVTDLLNTVLFLDEGIGERLMSYDLPLRLLTVACLTLNALHAARAPWMPRTLWS